MGLDQGRHAVRRRGGLLGTLHCHLRRGRGGVYRAGGRASGGRRLFGVRGRGVLVHRGRPFGGRRGVRGTVRLIRPAVLGAGDDHLCHRGLPFVESSGAVVRNIHPLRVLM